MAPNISIIRKEKIIVRKAILLSIVLFLFSSVQAKVENVINTEDHELSIIDGVQTLKISGRAISSSGVYIENVRVSASGVTDYTDANGYYELILPSPFTGALDVEKENWTQYTLGRYYLGVTTDQTENFRLKSNYCEATISNSGWSPYVIYSFELKGVTHSLSSATYYSESLSNYSKIELVKGFSYPFTIDGEQGYFAMWVDWNQDITFSEDERIAITEFSYTNPPYENGTVFTNNRIGTISVPQSAVAGLTRLRIRCSSTSSIAPCGSTLSGEIEDYEITVVDPCQATEIFYAGGKGTQEQPFLISTAEQLNELSKNSFHWNSYLKMTSDIDFNDITIADFHRIGDVRTAFAGVFDGDRYVIRDFTFQNDESHTSTSAHRVGLFGVVGSSGVIKNLNMIDPNIHSANGNAVGCIVGILESEAYISNCSVIGGKVSGLYAVGAIAGASSGNINKCFSDTNVFGHGSVGGMIGRIDGGYTDECYSMCNVDAVELVEYPSGLLSPITDISAGGFVGNVYGGNIEDCYSCSIVTSEDYGGGFANYIKYANSINKCYVTGNISAVHEGGFVRSSPTYECNCYWDTIISGITESAIGTGKTTEEMQTESTFTDAGWDFSTPVWKICEGTNYPKLAWQEPMAGDFICPDGVDLFDFTILAEQWMLWKLSYDVEFGNSDGIVNFMDWAMFADSWGGDMEQLSGFISQWLESGAYCGDIAPAPNGDGVVDIHDLAMLADNWLKD